MDNISLNRFIEAQEIVYPQVVRELQNGKKTSHWMWYIFPQIEGRGLSSTAKFYSIKNIDEAKAYLAHPILGKRLLECSHILLQLNNRSAFDIFGDPDTMKLRSCMTLFDHITPGEKVFAEVLEKYFEGKGDEKTIRLLN